MYKAFAGAKFERYEYYILLRNLLCKFVLVKLTPTIKETSSAGSATLEDTS